MLLEAAIEPTQALCLKQLICHMSMLQVLTGSPQLLGYHNLGMGHTILLLNYPHVVEISHWVCLLSMLCVLQSMLSSMASST